VHSVLARGAGALVLIASAGMKLRDPRARSEAFAAFGLEGERLQRTALGVLVAVELALGGAIAAGLAVASYAAALMMLGFGGELVVAISRGRAGEPCGCFGPRSRVGWPAVLRNIVLAAFYAALPSLPEPHLSATGWLAIGLGVTFAALCALGVAVLALAREVGALRLAVAPQAALEIEDEGPPLGSHVPVTFDAQPDGRMSLAVFMSENCPVCSALEPSIAFVARDPFLAVRVFDERRDAEVWRALGVPGSPYAVAFEPDGTVLAKGTFNSLGQLESVLATGERRRGALVDA